jgi:hypothetical protein
MSTGVVRGLEYMRTGSVREDWGCMRTWVVLGLGLYKLGCTRTGPIWGLWLYEEHIDCAIQWLGLCEDLSNRIYWIQVHCEKRIFSERHQASDRHFWRSQLEVCISIWITLIIIFLVFTCICDILRPLLTPIALVSLIFLIIQATNKNNA